MSRSCISAVGNTTQVQNIGGGVGVFKEKTFGNTLQLKSLAVTGTTMSVIEIGDTIYFSAQTGGGGGNSAANGLQVDGNNIVLGGNLTGSTLINVSSGEGLCFCATGGADQLFRFNPSGTYACYASGVGTGSRLLVSSTSCFGYEIGSAFHGIDVCVSCSQLHRDGGVSDCHYVKVAQNCLELYSSDGILIPDLGSCSGGEATMLINSTGKIVTGATSAGGSYTFTNGISESSGTVCLGGTLNQNTTISVTGDNVLTLGPSTNSINVYTGSTVICKNNFPISAVFCLWEDGRAQMAGLILSPSVSITDVTADSANERVRISSGNGGSVISSIDVCQALIKVCGSSGFPGIEYCSDYSGNYSARSLVDCAYVASQVSDCRLKCNLCPISPTIADFCGYSFEFNEITKCVDCCGYGFIAQEVEKYYPFAIKDDSRIIDGECYKGIDYQQLIPVMWNIIKELEARIAVLESQ
jgi:hypothetical protein